MTTDITGKVMVGIMIILVGTEDIINHPGIGTSQGIIRRGGKSNQEGKDIFLVFIYNRVVFPFRLYYDHDIIRSSRSRDRSRDKYNDHSGSSRREHHRVNRSSDNSSKRRSNHHLHRRSPYLKRRDRLSAGSEDDYKSSKKRRRGKIIHIPGPGEVRYNK